MQTLVSTFIGAGVILLIAYLYNEYKKRNDYDIEIDNKEELTKKDILNINQYNDEKADSRTDYIISILEKIKFWLTIIGIYFLIKIIATIIIAITYGAAITKALSYLTSTI